MQLEDFQHYVINRIAPPNSKGNKNLVDAFTLAVNYKDFKRYIANKETFEKEVINNGYLGFNHIPVLSKNYELDDQNNYDDNIYNLDENQFNQSKKKVRKEIYESGWEDRVNAQLHLDQGLLTPLYQDIDKFLDEDLQTFRKNYNNFKLVLNKEDWLHLFSKEIVGQEVVDENIKVYKTLRDQLDTHTTKLQEQKAQLKDYLNDLPSTSKIENLNQRKKEIQSKIEIIDKEIAKLVPAIKEVQTLVSRAEAIIETSKTHNVNLLRDNTLFKLIPSDAKDDTGAPFEQRENGVAGEEAWAGKQILFIVQPIDNISAEMNSYFGSKGYQGIIYYPEKKPNEEIPAFVYHDINYNEAIKLTKKAAFDCDTLMNEQLTEEQKQKGNFEEVKYKPVVYINDNEPENKPETMAIALSSSQGKTELQKITKDAQFALDTKHKYYENAERVKIMKGDDNLGLLTKTYDKDHKVTKITGSHEEYKGLSEENKVIRAFAHALSYLEKNPNAKEVFLTGDHENEAADLYKAFEALNISKINTKHCAFDPEKHKEGLIWKTYKEGTAGKASEDRFAKYAEHGREALSMLEAFRKPQLIDASKKLKEKYTEFFKDKGKEPEAEKKDGLEFKK